MKFLEFLGQAKKKSFWQSNRVICFRSEAYPLLFFRMLLDFLKKREIAEISFLQVNQKLQLWKTLQQSFLGETSFYWLGNIAEKLKSKKNEPDVVELLSLYRGPHSIAFFVSGEHKVSTSALKRMVVVDIPDTISRDEIQKLFSFFGMSVSLAKDKLIQDLITNAAHLSVDTSCMLAHYLSVTHVRFIGDLRKNLAAMIDPELSLYDLSQTFFSKKRKKFFSLWATCHNDYTVPFWVVYWGEQIWRAYNVVKFLRQNNFPAARRFSFRLPSSFIKEDWRQCSSQELKKAYQMIYDIDFAFKTGSTFCSLDLFYSSYFLGN